MSEARVVSLAPGAAPELRAIALEAFEEPWSEASFASELEQPTVLAFGFREGLTLRAFALFRAIFEEAELVLIATDPKSQGRGHGRVLCRHGIAALKERGVETIHLEVAEGNAPARALYLSLGFEEVGRRAAYYQSGDDALLMTLSIER